MESTSLCHTQAFESDLAPVSLTPRPSSPSGRPRHTAIHDVRSSQHMIMYSYYCAMACRLRKLASMIAPVITVLQITQMVVGSVVTVYSAAIHMSGGKCKVDPANYRLGLAMYLRYAGQGPPCHHRRRTTSVRSLPLAPAISAQFDHSPYDSHFRNLHTNPERPECVRCIMHFAQLATSRSSACSSTASTCASHPRMPRA